MAQDNKSAPAPGSPLQVFIHGVPEKPSATWTLAAGGRIYDNCWEALDRKKPKEASPAYRATGKRTGNTT